MMYVFTTYHSWGVLTLSKQNHAVLLFLCTLIFCSAAGSSGIVGAQTDLPLVTSSHVYAADVPVILNGLPIIYVAYSSLYSNSDLFPGAELRSLTYENGTWNSTVLVSCPDGWISDPAVSTDAETIVFAMKSHAADSFHIYAYNYASHAYTQLTRRIDVDDTAPVCLPGGDIIFVSTRDYIQVPGTYTRMPHLYRMGGDGSNIHRIGAPGAWEDHPTVLQDGRILYERAVGSCLQPMELWTMFPSGTKHTRYWQFSDTSEVSVSSAKPLGMTGRTVCLNDGVPVIIDREKSLTEFQSLTEYFGYSGNQIDSMPPIIESLHPIDEQHLLISGRYDIVVPSELYLVGPEGIVKLPSDSMECRTPVPLVPRQLARLHTHRTYIDEPAVFYVLHAGLNSHDTFEGERSIASLRIIGYNPPLTPIIDSNDPPRMGWNSYSEMSILGDVPVEGDGSAHFTVPAEHMVAFQLIDDTGQVIQCMSTPTMIQPGEITGCIGCHDTHAQTPPVAVQKVADALLREPSQPSLTRDIPGQIDFMRDIQPILSANCLRCHDTESENETTLDLSPDRTSMFSVSFEQLWKKNLISDNSQTLCAPFLQPSESAFLDSLRVGHQSVDCSSHDIDIISAWISCGAPFYATPLSPFSDNPGGRSPLTLDELIELAGLCSIPVDDFISPETSGAIMVNYDRPHLSACLMALDDTSNTYTQALDIIETGRSRLLEAYSITATFTVPYPKQSSATAADVIESQFRSAIQNGTHLYDGESELVRQPPEKRQ